MSTDQPRPGEPPEDDPFRKKPQEPTPPPGGSPYGSPPPGSGTPPPPPGGPYGGSGAGGGYPPPPPPYGGAGGGPGDPYGGSGGYGMPDPLAGMPPLADTGKRLVARIIDWLIVGIPLWILSAVFSSGWYTGAPDEGEDMTDAAAGWYTGALLLWLLLGIVAYIAYDWYFTQKSGQTLGKKAMRLRVAMLNDGTVPPSKTALGRAATLWLPSLVPCCGGLWWIVVFISILVDKPYQQGLHDKAAKTVVVQST